MTLLLDTGVIVRYLTDDPPEQGEKAQRLISASSKLLMTTVTLVEASHVLRSVYGIEREAVCDLLRMLIETDGVDLLDLPRELALEALSMARPSGRVSLADGTIWAVARLHAPATVFTFDQRFPAEGITREVPQ